MKENTKIKETVGKMRKLQEGNPGKGYEKRHDGGKAKL